MCIEYLARQWSQLIAIFLLGAVVGCSGQTGTGHTYGTWDNMEIDKCASAWLIKRHIDADARFAFFPSGSLVKDAIPFDTPEAEFRRTADHATYEKLLLAYDIEDEILVRIGDIIHSLEVVSWESPRTRIPVGVQRLDERVREIIRAEDDPHTCLQSSFAVFDSLYAAMADSNRRDTADTDR